MSGRGFLIAAIVALTTLATGTIAVGSSAAGSSRPKIYPPVKEGLPSTNGGCNAATTKNGLTTIPIKVNKVRDLVEPVVNMCFEGKGPYPMLIDTGAEFSVISSELAKELGLTSVGSPRPVRGAGCKTTAQNYELGKWSLGGIELEGGEISTIAKASKDKGHVRGSLGADVLSRFGFARIDFKNETLVVSGKERAVFTGSSKSASIPSGLVKSKPKLTVPMVVSAGSGGVSQKVEMGHRIREGGTVADRHRVELYLRGPSPRRESRMEGHWHRSEGEHLLLDHHGPRIHRDLVDPRGQQTRVADDRIVRRERAGLRRDRRCFHALAVWLGRL
jgi:hypothetical protein